MDLEILIFHELKTLNVSEEMIVKLKSKLDEIRDDKLKYISFLGRLSDTIKDSNRYLKDIESNENFDLLYLKLVNAYSKWVIENRVMFTDFISSGLEKTGFHLPEVFFTPPLIEPVKIHLFDDDNTFVGYRIISQYNFVTKYLPGTFHFDEETRRIFKIDSGPVVIDFDIGQRYFDIELMKGLRKRNVVYNEDENKILIQPSDVYGKFISDKILKLSNAKYPRVCVRCLNIWDGMEIKKPRVNTDLEFCNICSDYNSDYAKENFWCQLYHTNGLIRSYPINTRKIKSKGTNIKEISFDKELPANIKRISLTKNSTIEIESSGIIRDIKFRALDKDEILYQFSPESKPVSENIRGYYSWAIRRSSISNNEINFRKHLSDDISAEEKNVTFIGEIQKTDVLQLDFDANKNEYSDLCKTQTKYQLFDFVICLLYDLLKKEQKFSIFVIKSFLELLSTYIFNILNVKEIRKVAIIEEISNTILDFKSEISKLVNLRKEKPNFNSSLKKNVISILKELEENHQHNLFDYRKILKKDTFGVSHNLILSLYLNGYLEKKATLRFQGKHSLESITEMLPNKMAILQFLPLFVSKLRNHTLAHLAHSSAVVAACCEDEEIGCAYDTNNNSVLLYDNIDGSIGFVNTAFTNYKSERYETSWLLGFIPALESSIRICQNRLANLMLFDFTKNEESLKNIVFFEQNQKTELFGKIIENSYGLNDISLIDDASVIKQLGMASSYLTMLVNQEVIPFYWILKRIFDFEHDDLSIIRWASHSITVFMLLYLHKKHDLKFTSKIFNIALEKNISDLSLTVFERFNAILVDKTTTCITACPDCAVLQHGICEFSYIEQEIYLNRILVENEYFLTKTSKSLILQESTTYDDIENSINNKNVTLIFVPLNLFYIGATTKIHSLISKLKHPRRKTIKKVENSPQIVYYNGELSILYQFSKYGL